MITNVYGPTADNERNELLNELKGLKSGWSEPLCIRGDFIAFRFSSDTGELGGVLLPWKAFQSALILVNLLVTLLVVVSSLLPMDKTVQ